MDYHYAEALLVTPSGSINCTSGGKRGGSISFPFTASATVPASGVIDVANNLNFSTVPGLINNNDQTTSLSFTCIKTTPWKVSLDNGLHVDGTTRRMVSSSGDPMVFIPPKDAQEAQFLKDNNAIWQSRRRTEANPNFNRSGIPGLLNAVIASQNTNAFANTVLVTLKPGYAADEEPASHRTRERIKSSMT